MTTTTPGRRLHAALLAHGIESDNWDDCHPSYHAGYEAAARQYDEERLRAVLGPDRPGAFVAARGCLAPPDDGDLRDRHDALTAEVAALRRAQDADLYAGEEVGDRLARCEGRDGEIIERLGKLEKAVSNLNHAKQSIVAQQTGADQRTNAAIAEMRDRLAALEARALDAGDPLRRTG